MPDTRTSLPAVASVMAILAAASAIVQRTDDEIAGYRVLVESLRLHTEPLHQQIASLQAGANVVDGPDEAQVAALVSDPGKAVDIEAITARVHSARAETDATNMAVATIQAAIDLIEADIADTEAKITALQRRRDGEFREFAVAIQSNLGPLFESEFLRLRDTVMMPLLAVAKLRTSDGNADLLSVRDPGAVKFSWDSLIALDAWQPALGQYNTKRLFEARGITHREAESVVQSFRDILAGWPASAVSAN